MSDVYLAYLSDRAGITRGAVVSDGKTLHLFGDASLARLSKDQLKYLAAALERGDLPHETVRTVAGRAPAFKVDGSLEDALQNLTREFADF